MSDKETPELELELEADSRWLAEFTRFPGVAAYGPTKEEAIWNAAKVLIEATAEVTPTRANRMALRCPHCNKEGANSTDAGGNELCFHCGSCGFAECEWSSPAHEGFEGTSEQASPTPDTQAYGPYTGIPYSGTPPRNTGVSLDGGKTIHSKFKND